VDKGMMLLESEAGRAPTAMERDADGTH
jgi:hypothetical protein